MKDSTYFIIGNIINHWKALLLVILVVGASLTVKADQLSIQESSLMNATSMYYTSADRRIQYNYDFKKNKVSYQYMKIKENIIGYFTDPPSFPMLWQDPSNKDLSAVSVGFYINF